MRYVRYAVLAMLFLPWFAAHSYELATHGALTYEAFKRSILSPNPIDPQDPQFLRKVLGIENGANSFGTIYYDIAGSTVRERTRDIFEQDKNRMPPGTQPLSVEGWLMRGAIREDDAYGEDNPQDDRDPANAELRRPLHHFFDPTRNRGLDVFGIELLDSDIHTAPAWALGTTNANAFTQSNAPEVNRRNHFSIFDAREAMYRALTGKKADGNDDPQATGREGRNKYWATTFRALGDAVHLIQDMGQPQHTRNDPHAGKFPEFLTGHASAFEKYIEARATGAMVYDIDGQRNVPLEALTAIFEISYPKSGFTKYSDFWSTNPGPRSATGQGLADYSNSGFFSAGTNLGSNDYPLPSNDAANYTRESAAGLLPARPRERIHFLRGGADNILMTTDSIFDLFLVNTPPTYSLNRFNYDDQASLLIPRAVAYSAGLIDYFFRGRLEVQDASFSDNGIVLRVKNGIDPVTQDYWANEVLTGGRLVVTLKYELPIADGSDNATMHYTSDPVVLSEALRPGRVSLGLYEFTGFPVVPPANARNVEYRLVYRGSLGQEADAVVAGVFKPVSGFLVTPNYAPADGLSGAGDKRLIYYTQGKWHLDKNTSVVAGNIDWKGWYVGDKPTKVLSWVGPPMRYLPAREFYVSQDQRTYSESDFSNVVYQNGEVFAIAPKNVLGAAVARDSSNIDWLIVVCTDGAVDVVYRRPYKKSDSAEGWELIGSSESIQDSTGFTQSADVPWFFNGPGTQAQTMRRWWKNDINWSGGLLKRLTLELSPDLRTAVFGVASLGDEGFVAERSCSADYDQYGAGSAQRTSTSRGEYTFAVDYKNEQPVFAKIRIEGQSAAQSTVNVSHDHDPGQHGQDVITGTTVGPSSYREYLIFETVGGDSTQIEMFSDLESYSTNWVSGGGASPTYEYTGTRDTKANEVTYFFDLRSDLYSYYFWNFKDTTQIANGIEIDTEDGNEGSVLREGEASIALHSNAFPHYEDTRPAVSRGNEIQCASFDNGTVRRYGTSNFGWWSYFGNAVGNAAKNGQGHQAHSQHILADFGFYLVGAANTLSPDGSIESTVPTVPQDGAIYHPIQLVR